MDADNPATRRQPAGCTGTAARVTYFLIIAAVGYLVVRGITDTTATSRVVRTGSIIRALSMGLDAYRQVYDVDPPDKATGLDPDLDKPSECLVRYLSKAPYHEFNKESLRDTDGDGIPEVVDAWGHPFIYNSGPEQDGPFNQNGAPKHNTKRFDLSSAGPDEKHGTDDDVTNW